MIPMPELNISTIFSTVFESVSERVVAGLNAVPSTAKWVVGALAAGGVAALSLRSFFGRGGPRPPRRTPLVAPAQQAVAAAPAAAAAEVQHQPRPPRRTPLVAPAQQAVAAAPVAATAPALNPRRPLPPRPDVPAAAAPVNAAPELVAPAHLYPQPQQIPAGQVIPEVAARHAADARRADATATAADQRREAVRQREALDPMNRLREHFERLAQVAQGPGANGEVLCFGRQWGNWVSVNGLRSPQIPENLSPLPPLVLERQRRVLEFIMRRVNKKHWATPKDWIGGFGAPKMTKLEKWIFRWSPEKLVLAMLEAVDDLDKDPSLTKLRGGTQEYLQCVREMKKLVFKEARSIVNKEKVSQETKDKIEALIKKLSAEMPDWENDLQLRAGAEDLHAVVDGNLLGPIRATGWVSYNTFLANEGWEPAAGAQRGYAGVSLLNEEQVSEALQKLEAFESKLARKNRGDLENLLVGMSLKGLQEEIAGVKKQLQEHRQFLRKLVLLDLSKHPEKIVTSLGCLVHVDESGRKTPRPLFSGISDMSYAQVEKATADLSETKEKIRNTPYYADINLAVVDCAMNGLARRKKALEQEEKALRQKAIKIGDKLDDFMENVQKGEEHFPEVRRHAAYEALVADLDAIGDRYTTIAKEPFGPIDEVKIILEKVNDSGNAYDGTFKTRKRGSLYRDTLLKSSKGGGILGTAVGVLGIASAYALSSGTVSSIAAATIGSYALLFGALAGGVFGVHRKAVQWLHRK